MADTHSSHQDQPGYETRDVDLKKVAIWAVVTTLLVIFSVIFVWDYFIGAREKIVERVVLAPESTELRELRAREAEELGTYKLLDSAKGQYRIPIERAMELVAEEAYRSQAAAGGAR
jgi:hypothetical protein